MDPELILRDAVEALERGDYSFDEVDQIITENTEFQGLDGLWGALGRVEGLKYPNAFAMRMAFESAEDFVDAEEMKQVGRLGGLPSTVGSLIQSLTFGAADEIVGSSRAGRRLGPKLERAQESRERHAPVADLAAQVAGGLMIPGGTHTAATRTMRPGLARGVARGASKGALSGGAGGAAAGYFTAPEGQEVQAARTGAAAGAAAGAALGVPMGAVGGIYGANAGRGARVAEDMIDLADRPRAGLGLRGMLHEIDGAKGVVQRDLYRPLQEINEAIDDPGIDAAVFSVASDPSFRTVLPRRLRVGTNRLAGGRGGGTIIRRNAARPSFQDMQDLRGKLRQMAYDRDGSVKDRDALAKLTEVSEAMQDFFGEPLQQADAAWSALIRQEEAANSGWKMFNRTADEIEIKRDELKAIGDHALNSFDDARLARIADELQRANRGSVGLLVEYMNAGPSMERRVRSLFPDEATYSQFKSMLETEASNARLADFFNSAVKSGAIGAAGGAITGGLFARGQR